jgi:hypothetical protein
VTARLVIAPCGAQKQIVATRADEMYTGSYASLCLQVAQRLACEVQPSRIVILSAKYGFLDLDLVIEPYNVTFGDPSAITLEQLREQAERMHLAAIADVHVLGGRRYVDTVRALWPHAAQVIPAGVGGIGRQLAWLRKAAHG